LAKLTSDIQDLNRLSLLALCRLNYDEAAFFWTIKNQLKEFKYYILRIRSNIPDLHSKHSLSPSKYFTYILTNWNFVERVHTNTVKLSKIIPSCSLDFPVLKLSDTMSLCFLPSYKATWPSFSISLRMEKISTKDNIREFFLIKSLDVQRDKYLKSDDTQRRMKNLFELILLNAKQRCHIYKNLEEEILQYSLS
jgi:hypothetical protein